MKFQAQSQWTKPLAQDTHEQYEAGLRLITGHTIDTPKKTRLTRYRCRKARKTGAWYCGAVAMIASPQRGERFTKHLFSLSILATSILNLNSQNASLGTVFKLLMPVSSEVCRVYNHEDIRFSTASYTDLLHSSCFLQRLDPQADIHQHSCSNPSPNAAYRQLPSQYRHVCHLKEYSTHHAENLWSHLAGHPHWLDQESHVMPRSGTVEDQAVNRIA